MYPENAWDCGAVLEGTIEVCRGCSNLATRVFAGEASPVFELEKKLRDDVKWATNNRALVMQMIQDIKDIGRLSDKMMQPETFFKIRDQRVRIMQQSYSLEKALDLAKKYVFKIDYWVWLVRRCLENSKKIKAFTQKVGLFNHTYDWYLEQALAVYLRQSQKFGPARPRKPLPPAPVVPAPARPTMAAPMGAPVRVASPPVVIPTNVTTEQVLKLW